MPVTGAPDAGGLDAATLAEIERVRASGVLGRGGRLSELFEFLVTRSDSAAPPKEFEIAFEVFGKTDAEAVKDDPVARVYVHRLRRRLDDFYLRHPTDDGVRLTVPKGEYRILGARADAAAALEPLAPGPRGRAVALLEILRRRWRIAAVVALLLLGNLAAWPMLAVRAGGGDGDVARLRQHSVWGGLMTGSKPILIVVGDYYMFAESEGGMNVDRLVRQFSINSKEDLLELQRDEPETGERYADVNMKYLPTSTAFALADIMPLIPDGRSVRVALASEINPEALKDYDVVYVGLLSGMGALREPAFAASRFGLGDTYDEIVDSQTGEHYMSEAFFSSQFDGMYRDYGFFSSFDGPNGNRIVIIAGERDTAVMGVAENLTRRGGLDDLAERADGASSLEAVYEIQAQGDVSLEGRVVAAAPRDESQIWTSDAQLWFPPE
jgi:hypothetical protein